MPEEASIQSRELFMNKTRKHIFISIVTLILASLACGSIQVGVVAPTLEASMLSTNQAQKPETELTINDDIDSQIVYEPTLIPTEQVPEYSIPTMAYKGPDDNVWLLEAGSQTPVQVTFDANPTGGGQGRGRILKPPPLFRWYPVGLLQGCGYAQRQWA